jgi:uncharacterized protein DUF3857
VPAQIELLETHFRFEADGASRKEVHAKVHINSELGTRQFARLNFDYNRAFESVEVPLARVTHPSGGTEDILPSSVTDQPNPAVVEAPAYGDVRRKSVRILGLQPGDNLEYRVITSGHAPLAPDFFLFHSFAKDDIVAHEEFQLDLPTSRVVQLRVSPETPAKSEEKSGSGDSARIVRRWEYSWATAGKSKAAESADPDIALTTFTSWKQLSAKLADKYSSPAAVAPELVAKSAELTKSAKTAVEKIEALYDFTSLKIATLDLPLDANGFRIRPPGEILSSGYGTAPDKAALLAALLHAATLPAAVTLAGAPDSAESSLPRPSVFTHVLVWTATEENSPGFWLDPGAEVAPFRMIASNLRGKPALLLLSDDAANASRARWRAVPDEVPFPASQNVNVEASLGADGKLNAKVHYALRGDNELLLRVAFHQTAKEKWKDLAQLLSISDGFRGKVTSVSASNATDTRQPFTIDYEIVVSKFVDWSKKPVRIPALLPQIGLPDPPGKNGSPASAASIELGTPLDVDTRATLKLPPGTTVHAPTGTSVERDYATFSSKYSQQDVTVSAARRVRFLMREIPTTRSTDYNAFLHAVQNDEAQDFVLERSTPPIDDTKPAAKKTAAQ